MRILFAGGGTGGHFFPILAVIRELKKMAEREQILDLEFFYLGPDDFGKELLKEEDAVSVKIRSGKMRRYFSWRNFGDVLKIFVGTGQALWNMFLIMPDVVFSKGGYGALPAVLAAAVFRIPILIHESDAVPGKVNEWSGKFAKKIGIAFASAQYYFPKEKTALVGIPIRQRILGQNPKDAKEYLNIFSVLPVVGFIGASQGAQKLNEAVLGVLKELAADYEILHQTGANNFQEVREQASVILEGQAKDHYHIFGFLNEDQLKSFYAASDLIVSRAGASSIFEIAASAKPSILVPLERAAQDHQRKNAYEYAATGACSVIEENNLTPHILLAEIKKVLGNPELMRQMSRAAESFARIDAGEVIAREILKLGIH